MENNKINKRDIIIRKCIFSDVDDIFSVQNIVVDNLKDAEKTYFSHLIEKGIKP